jgi:uncharacterized UBP type Zn finger protein
MASKEDPVAATAAAVSATVAGDKSLARKLHAIEQLTQMYGFNLEDAQEAVEAVGADAFLSEACKYLIDVKGCKDSGGAIAPIENCPHLDHVKLALDQLPNGPDTTVCSHFSATKTGNKKSVTTDEGKCPEGENWVCLECGVIRCSRYINGHGLTHWKDTQKECQLQQGHCIAVSLADLSVWCHCCSAYVRDKNTIDPIVQQLEALKFQVF